MPGRALQSGSFGAGGRSLVRREDAASRHGPALAWDTALGASRGSGGCSLTPWHIPCREAASYGPLWREAAACTRTTRVHALHVGMHCMPAGTRLLPACTRGLHVSRLHHHDGSLSLSLPPLSARLYMPAASSAWREASTCHAWTQARQAGQERGPRLGSSQAGAWTQARQARQERGPRLGSSEALVQPAWQ